MIDEPLLNGEKVVRDESGRFVEGHPPLSEGRPKGRYSLTSQIIKRLEEHPEQAKDIMDWLIANRKDLVWNKIDPNPPTDFNIGGELPIRIIEIIKPNELKLKDAGDQSTI